MKLIDFIFIFFVWRERERCNTFDTLSKFQQQINYHNFRANFSPQPQKQLPIISSSSMDITPQTILHPSFKSFNSSSTSSLALLSTDLMLLFQWTWAGPKIVKKIFFALILYLISIFLLSQYKVWVAKVWIIF